MEICSTCGVRPVDPRSAIYRCEECSRDVLAALQAIARTYDVVTYAVDRRDFEPEDDRQGDDVE